MKKILTPLIVCSVVVGFTVVRSQAPKGRPVHVIGGIDVSDSVRRKGVHGGHLLGRSIELTSRLGSRLKAQHDRLTLFRVERETREFYSDFAPRSRDKFQWMLVNHTKPAATSGGTFPARFWAEAARRASQSSMSVVVVYTGDADNDDQTAASRQAIVQAARELAANAKVREVAVYGAHPKNWETLRLLLAPLDAKGILHLHSADEMSPGALLQRIDALRWAGQKSP